MEEDGKSGESGDESCDEGDDEKNKEKEVQDEDVADDQEMGEEFNGQPKLRGELDKGSKCDYETPKESL